MYNSNQNFGNKNQGGLFKANIIADLALIDIIQIGAIVWAVSEVSNNDIEKSVEATEKQNDQLLSENKKLFEDNIEIKKQNIELSEKIDLIIKLLEKK